MRASFQNSKAKGSILEGMNLDRPILDKLNVDSRRKGKYRTNEVLL